MSKVKLKPCPFCGARAKIRYKRVKTIDSGVVTTKLDIDDLVYIVGCENPDCILGLTRKGGHLFFTGSRREYVADKWNDRKEQEEVHTI